MVKSRLALPFVIAVTAALLSAGTSTSQQSPLNREARGGVGSGLHTSVRPSVSIASVLTARSQVVTTTTTAPTKTAKPIGLSWSGIFTRYSRQLPGTWIIQQNEDNKWGRTRLSTGEVFIDPDTPADKLRDVMFHESIHVRQGQIYGGLEAATQAMLPYGGLEAVADCGAKKLGALWTHYIQNCTAAMNYAADAMLRGERI